MIRRPDFKKAPPAYIVERDVGADGFSVDRVIDNRMAVLEWELKQRHVSPAIIERVMRLNHPDRIDGVLLRGMHRKPTGPMLHRGLIQKGEIIRRYGREAWARIPREEWVKEGRRVFVSYRALDRAQRLPPVLYRLDDITA